jgi:hypothetical protein
VLEDAGVVVEVLAAFAELPAKRFAPSAPPARVEASIAPAITVFRI